MPVEPAAHEATHKHIEDVERKVCAALKGTVEIRLTGTRAYGWMTQKRIRTCAMLLDASVELRVVPAL